MKERIEEDWKSVSTEFREGDEFGERFLRLVLNCKEKFFVAEEAVKAATTSTENESASLAAKKITAR